ncbi:pentatricopeptide repeat-containing protein At2g13600-like [Salvia miltiorrhiza]|uniref:pentatricopeptide repeat-containing protein At2g13600-like n=1 Tax=Salvia miltiorrhiza TaxID=226208 RepID=UPI0025AB6D82|nr:pentatricopeptide repeat-containing protein At2g13600-like [Salvia miltiorrhiza]
MFSTNARKNLNAFIRKSVSLLEICTNERLINHGNALHCQLIKMGLSSHKYIAVKLLIMYLDSRKSLEINQMLKGFDGFNLVVHNCLINANLKWGNAADACRLFDEMPERNEVSWTSLISGLLKHGKVDEAIHYFKRNPFSDVFSWTATISGLVYNRLSFRAMMLFREMLRFGVLPNAITFTSVVKACIELRDLGLAMSVLGLIMKLGFEGNVCVLNSLVTFFLRLGHIDSARKTFDRIQVKDVVSWTTMLDMYVEMGELVEARRVFDEMPERNEVTWSAMIARLSQSGDAVEAARLFQEMVRCGFKPNISCYSSVISALASLQGLEGGKSIHGHVLKSGVDMNVFVGCSLIDLYCKCGNSNDGRLVFDALPQKNVVCWNSMVSGYSSNGRISEAVELFNLMPQRNNVSWNSLIAGHLVVEDFGEAFEVFHHMILCGEQPSKSTFSSVLRACASLASLEKGKYAHAKAVKLGFQRDLFVDTALLDMYAKSGEIGSSVKIFNGMENKNDVVWTAMIQGLAENGFAEESLQRFEEMESVAPNELILLSVLFACSHCGLVDKGLAYFNSMERVYGIRPNQRHYTCVVDMLSRAGRLCEAEKFITSMPMPCEAEANAWSALLSGCKTYGDEELGARASEKLSELAEAKPGAYVLLSNSYASGGRWVDAMNTRNMMSRKGIKKSGGCSWIELRNRVHVFYSQDETHTQWTQMQWILQLLNTERQSYLA